MDPKQIADVWRDLDRDYLAGLAQKGPAPVFATISGAHLYGFASPDSDVDLRGAFLLSAEEMLGLHPPQETFSLEDNSVIDLDWVAHDLQTWEARRNPARAELERRHGYDTKHAAHLVRLMRMGLEALQTGDLLVRRPDADELLAIRDGALDYDELLATARELQTRIAAAAESTGLPDDIEPDFVDALARELIETAASSPS